MVKVYYEMFEPTGNQPVYMLLDEVQLVNNWYCFLSCIPRGKRRSATPTQRVPYVWGFPESSPGRDVRGKKETSSSPIIMPYSTGT